jgi:hypothetical protein
MLAFFVHYWPVAIFAPAVLLLIALLAGITRWWDQRDRAAEERALWSGRQSVGSR